MRVFLDVLLLLLNIAILPYFLFLLGIALAALVAGRARRPAGEPRSRFLIVIPAHDEEAGISSTVASCLGSDYPGSLYSVMVIADNCTDRTAAVAQAGGARVTVRYDSQKKSKGYAIEYLIDRLKESGEFDALDGLVVVDADTQIDADMLRRFDADVQAGRDWIQCYYTVANPDQSWRTRLMSYAFSLINGVMPLGQYNLGTSAGLRGNGMCFSTRGLRRRPWVAYGLVEDMEFSWMLRLEGERIAFQPSTRVYGAMLGSGGSAAANQRRRWEFGRGEIRLRYLPLVLRARRLGWWEKVLSFGELTLPTMTTLYSIFLILAGLSVLDLLAIPPGSTAIRWAILACDLLMAFSACLYALTPFVVMRLPWRYMGTLAFFPIFAVWKSLVALGGRPKSWVRTPREQRTSGSVA